MTRRTLNAVGFVFPKVKGRKEPIRMQIISILSEEVTIKSAPKTQCASEISEAPCTLIKRINSSNANCELTISFAEELRPMCYTFPPSLSQKYISNVKEKSDWSRRVGNPNFEQLYAFPRELSMGLR